MSNNDFFEVTSNREVTKKWRPATTAEYADYIVKRIESGRKITAFVHSDMKPSHGIAIATHQIRGDELRGAGGLAIIVPEKFTPPHQTEGRTKFMLMETGGCIGNGYPYMPLFKDTVAELKMRGYSSRYLEKAVEGTEWKKKELKKELKQAFSAVTKPSAPKASIKEKLLRKIPGLH